MKKDTKDTIKIAGLIAGGVIAWQWLSKKDLLPGFPGPGAVVGGMAEQAAGAIGSAVWNIPVGIAKGLGAEKIGEGLYGVMTSESRTEEYFARVQWGETEQKGIPTEMPSYLKYTTPFGFLPTPRIPHPEVVTLGPATKTFIEEAPWREDPTAFAGLPGPTIGGVTYPSVEAYLEAQRAKYVKAGCID